MKFYIPSQDNPNALDREAILYSLCVSWSEFPTRFNIPESDWVAGLSGYLETITQMRATHVQEWIHQNLERFKASHASLEALKQACDTALIELKENAHLCKAQCSACNLLCLQSHGHGFSHNCQTSHHCPHLCGVSDEHIPGEEKRCGFRYAIPHLTYFLANPFSVLDIQGGICMFKNSLFRIHHTKILTC